MKQHHLTHKLNGTSDDDVSNSSKTAMVENGEPANTSSGTDPTYYSDNNVEEEKSVELCSGDKEPQTAQGDCECWKLNKSKNYHNSQSV